MSVSDKLFFSRISFSVIAAIVLLLGYAIYVTYSNEIQEELVRFFGDSFGHIKGELANL